MDGDCEVLIDDWKYQVSDIRYQVSSIRYQISGIKNWWYSMHWNRLFAKVFKNILLPPNFLETFPARLHLDLTRGRSLRRYAGFEPSAICLAVMPARIQPLSSLAYRRWENHIGPPLKQVKNLMCFSWRTAFSTNNLKYPLGGGRPYSCSSPGKL